MGAGFLRPDRKNEGRRHGSLGAICQRGMRCCRKAASRKRRHASEKAPLPRKLTCSCIFWQPSAIRRKLVMVSDRVPAAAPVLMIG
jgi:hypothetical protein